MKKLLSLSLIAAIAFSACTKKIETVSYNVTVLEKVSEPAGPKDPVRFYILGYADPIQLKIRINLPQDIWTKLEPGDRYQFKLVPVQVNDYVSILQFNYTR